jgi:CO/xanthine dehydrogenase Mo-binding subunit
MQYRIPTRQDIGHIEVELVSSYEERGPFGAKSIGEVVINTPGPAIQEAIYQATGKRFYELPITPEQICMAFKEKGAQKQEIDQWSQRMRGLREDVPHTR